MKARFLSIKERTMSKVILNHVKKRDADGAEVAFTVGDYKVTAIFPADGTAVIFSSTFAMRLWDNGYYQEESYEHEKDSDLLSGRWRRKSQNAAGHISVAKAKTGTLCGNERSSNLRLL
jgi:hypothetical protein